MKEKSSFEVTPFTDIVRHCLLDQFEFSFHSFEGLERPYYWNGIGALSTPLPDSDVLKDAKNRQAHTIYLAHTHVLSGDDSLKFLNAKTDPREEVAYGLRPLPMGNPPSYGDIKYFKHLKAKFFSAGIAIKGVVFAASGVWEFDIDQNLALLKFKRAYEAFYPIPDDPSFFKNLNKSLEFPSYYMELQKHAIYSKKYKTKLTQTKQEKITVNSNAREIAKTLKFYNNNGVKLSFHAYKEFDIDPLFLMREIITNWSDKLFVDTWLENK